MLDGFNQQMKLLDAEDQGFAADKLGFYYPVACREIFETTGGSYELRDDGLLRHVEGDPKDDGCRELDLRLTSPFDPSRHSFSGQMYYINGTLDSKTPLAGAEEHFKVHSSARKELVAVAEGGHGPLFAEDELLPCSPAVFAAIVAGRPLTTVLGEDGHCRNRPPMGLTSTSPSLERLKLRRLPLE